MHGVVAPGDRASAPSEFRAFSPHDLALRFRVTSLIRFSWSAVKAGALKDLRSGIP